MAPSPEVSKYLKNLLDSLEKYATHTSDCSIHTNGFESPCSCGYRDAIRYARIQRPTQSNDWGRA